jgi:hypothetical protein
LGWADARLALLQDPKSIELYLGTLASRVD